MCKTEGCSAHDVVYLVFLENIFLNFDLQSFEYSGGCIFYEKLFIYSMRLLWDFYLDLKLSERQQYFCNLWIIFYIPLYYIIAYTRSILHFAFFLVKIFWEFLFFFLVLHEHMKTIRLMGQTSKGNSSKKNEMWLLIDISILEHQNSLILPFRVSSEMASAPMKKKTKKFNSKYNLF